ncbi:PREDICTED: hepatitis A virus cellular receptor 1-like isoform X1 [Myotis davidii]|uniref:hepatitis A virus cellular receptor 1-like isoform X1 n=1 Tax=Myotis davidii TaxID=225400 RepID=UPI000767598F|nr:PREDICTED: hepatitis A virus cellular receptor 1-like isoform X1 [Myotis davidii]
MGPTSPMISSTKPAGGPQKFKTETISSSPLQTTETPPITPQETSTTSSLLNSSCPTDGNSTVTQPSDCGWQYNVTHTSLKQNTPRNTSKLYIGLCSAAMILLTILAAILTKKYLCGKRMVLQISKEPRTGTSQNGTAVHYQAQENIYFENNLYNMP